MSDFKIEKGVPLHLKIEKGVPLPGSRIKWNFDKMDVGDSFFIDNEKTFRKVRAAASFYKAQNKNSGWNYTIRKVENGYRIWRTA